ncbi:MFS transporter [Leptolyngbya sp. FACHB-261]|uniref:MFS transporter n=1 Tax=Leptolyngbya sp. FACHB-261 TaxID=2692806 RepID=UPI001681FF46|nr:MFS transporter [Leptolyngbya sp. FACHB-261]MBD2102932.1 MFS transporter [Leptolyngbya sp. FACHB-261]
MSDELIDPAVSSSEDKLSLSTKLAYGAGDLGPAITANILVFFLLPFFTNVAGLGAGIAGSILAVSKIWDAVNDPIVGVLSDRTRSRWGRRRPWILFGAIPFGLAFFAQWFVPFPGNTWALVAYYILISVLFNSFYTAVNLPYTALTPELTQDYDERTSLTQFRFAFSIGGSLVSGILHPLIVGQFENNLALGYVVSGAIWSVLSVLPLFWCFWGTRERYQEDIEDVPFREQFRIALSNRPYLFVIGIYLFSWLAVQVTASIIPYYITFWMRLPNSWIALTILAVQGTAFAMLFVWNAISARIGKKAVYLLGMVLWILAQAGLFIVQPGQPILMLALAVAAGIGVATAYLIPWSMVPDVIELDELTTGQRREGVFYGLMVLLQKVGLAAGLFFVGQALEWSGFQGTSPDQPEAALTAIRIMIGPIPTIALILGIILAYFYPITKERHAQILLQLAERKKASG